MTTTTPQRKTYYESMLDRMRDALQNREQYYQGLDEATNDWETQRANSPVRHATDAEAARQIFQNSAQGKLLIGNNRWHMAQAMMFGVADLAHTAHLIYIELRAIRKALEKQSIPSQRRPE